MNINELTLGQIKEIQALVGGTTEKPEANGHWEVGFNYFIRTVTHHFTGMLVAATDKELVLVDAAWIADDGRFNECIANGTCSEVEPFPDGQEVIIGRGSLIDATRWNHDLPRTVK